MKNTLDRRTFLASGTLTLLGTLAMAHPRAIKVYHIPLHDASIRPGLTDSPLKTLNSLAAVGYKELEYTGPDTHTYYGKQPGEFRKILDDTPITIPIAQLVFGQAHWLESRKEVSDSWKKLLENASTVGHEYIISPRFDWDLRDPEALKRGIEAYNMAGEISDQAGIRLGFHPTARELEVKYQGKPVYDYLLRNLESRQVCQQLDLGMMARAGQDSVEWMRLYPHHFESLHIQDHPQAGTTPLPLGTGSLPLDDILAFVRKNTPMKYWVIKPVASSAETILKAAGADLQRFKQYGFQ